MSQHRRPKPSNRESGPITSAAELRAAVYGFRRSRIILTAFELGLFSHLSAGRLTAEKLARMAGADARAVDRLLNALCALGLVKKAGRQFANTKISRTLLVADEPEFLAGLAHSASQWQSWHTLSAAVRRGTSVYKREGEFAGVQRLPGFIAAMHERAVPQAAEIVKLLDLAKVKRCLDIGSGSGAYAMALVRAKKSISVAAFDLPEVLPLTRQYVARAGLLSRFDFLAGDFHRGGWGKGYDLVLLSAIVHMNGQAENRRLIARAAASLNPGGQLVIQDFIMEPNRTRPLAGAFFALNMLVATKAGDTFTAGELGGWMREAGLKKIVRRRTPFDASLLIGRKP